VPPVLLLSPPRPAASFAKDETDEGLAVTQPIVVEGELVVIRHPARGQLRAVVELQVRGARKVTS